MVKYLFIFINSFLLFIFGLFSGDNGITVTSNIPSAMNPGQEVTIELKVSKGNMSGFAKLQLDLPAGFTVKEVDNMGSNYSFEDGIAKWVWASLPNDEELVVKCVLGADKEISGMKTIGAKYSYVEKNAKVVVEMTPVEVNVSGDVVTGNPGNNENTGTTQTTTPQNTVAANTNAEPTGNINVERTISKAGPGEYQVDLKITKGMTKGFARYSDELPADLSARAVKTEGASFSLSDGKVKFVWVNAPEAEVFEISYIISGLKQPLSLSGEYSYLEQNLSKTYNLPSETIQPETVAANSNTGTSGTETTGGTSPSETLPKKDASVSYMVQIGAFTNANVTAAKLKRKFGISDKIKSEMQGGYSKFMVGDHANYRGARDQRERIRSSNGVASAFVVAYNTGRRITVQEALMITNQKWFK